MMIGNRRDQAWIGLAAVGLVGLLTVAGAGAVLGQEEGSEAPAAGFAADYSKDLGRVGKKLISLAEAVPAEKYGWRPAEGVRSVSETYMHVAAANHQLLQALGHEAPEGVGEWEKITDKDEVIKSLEGSFAAVRQAASGVSQEALDDMVDFFGGQWSKRAVLLLVCTHAHEHLGQSIAYARSIGVVPPWSRPAEE